MTGSEGKSEEPRLALVTDPNRQGGTTSQDEDRPKEARSTFINAYRVAAVLTAVLVFLQAVLAGRLLFVDPDTVDTHEIVANVLSSLVFAQVVLAFLAPFPNKTLMRAVTALLAVLIVAQTGLGYVGRDEPDAAAVHVPLGVLIFGLSAVVATLSLTSAGAASKEDDEK